MPSQRKTPPHIRRNQIVAAGLSVGGFGQPAEQCFHGNRLRKVFQRCLTMKLASKMNTPVGAVWIAGRKKSASISL
jgi:hypothetical protein